jgi:uncharacterized protein YdaU (DUF1376 family)
MNKLHWIIIINLIIGMCAVSGCDKLDGVSKNMETLAKVLYASSRNTFEANNYIFEKVEVVETGKDLGQGRPVKFKMNGIHGYKALSSPPPGLVLGARAWVGEFIEKEEKFDDTFVVFYTKDEFGKIRACIEGGFYCVSEENIEQHRAKLEDMVIQHKLAKEQDAQRQVEYSQQQAREEAERQNQVKFEQLRVQAQVPTVTLGKYRCYDRWITVYTNPEPLGEVVLTDVDASYVHIYPNEPPYRVKVVFEFSNINQISKGEQRTIHFNLKRDIWSRPGDSIANIFFSDVTTMDRFYDDIVKAKKAWDQKHPELK